MFAGSVLIGFTLIGFAVWLHFNDQHGWQHESFDGELDRQYLSRRRRSRRWVHLIFGMSGFFSIVAAIAGPGTVWMGAWACVALSLMTIVLLAGLDAIRTLRYQSRKRPEIHRSLLDQED
ncbi:hypothetical protein [Novipirellula artificiosorum]|uniref:Uncharacterized protein n=1 Tax=Novipirellula artificiosorum TaxID=2528016 RepID=A0A5C6DHN6_9BACT|nr:hypothetical protein [Novipirellula artificiosorum]TWU34469.1 hypothetical protein Poly41_46170 [Novipirellula artificiosorum]